MIYIFGDSFSEPFIRYANKSYVTHMGYSPKQYYDYFQEEYNMDCVNTAKGGASNDYIFNEFMGQYENMVDGDLVIFGWSQITRFEFVDTKIGAWRGSLLASNQDSLSMDTIDEIVVNRNHPLYTEQFCKRLLFINTILKGKKVIHWSWVHHEKHYSITTETKGRVEDGHYGEYGHQQIYNILSKGIKDKDVFNYNMIMCYKTISLI